MKFGCLKPAVSHDVTPLIELEAAWSQLTTLEIEELNEGKVEFNRDTEFSPLHYAVQMGNQPAVEFLKVREIILA